MFLSAKKVWVSPDTPLAFILSLLYIMPKKRTLKRRTVKKRRGGTVTKCCTKNECHISGTGLCDPLNTKSKWICDNNVKGNDPRSSYLCKQANVVTRVKSLFTNIAPPKNTYTPVMTSNPVSKPRSDSISSTTSTASNSSYGSVSSNTSRASGRSMGFTEDPYALKNAQQYHGQRFGGKNRKTQKTRKHGK